MKTAPNAPNAETKEWLATLVERAKALDAIFACGGAVDLAAPLALRGPGRKKLEIVERNGFRRTNVDKVEQTVPDKPNSRLQKYRVTAAARAAVAKTSGE